VALLVGRGRAAAGPAWAGRMDRHAALALGAARKCAARLMPSAATDRQRCAVCALSAMLIARDLQMFVAGTR